jgi:hypothetical protein
MRQAQCGGVSYVLTGIFALDTRSTKPLASVAFAEFMGELAQARHPHGMVSGNVVEATSARERRDAGGLASFVYHARQQIVVRQPLVPQFFTGSGLNRPCCRLDIREDRRLEHRTHPRADVCQDLNGELT